MDKTPKFKLNNYVLYKFNNEWHEGRINRITTQDDKEFYHILSFATLNEFTLKTEESLTISNPENKRKLKLVFMNNLVGRIHVPYVLKSLMMIDKEWVQYNTIPFPAKSTAAHVLNKAKIFFIENGLSDSEEIIEVINGFAWAFNMFFYKFLLFEAERAQFTALIPNVVETYGTSYLLRLLYFLQIKGQEYIKDSVVYSIVYEYTIYLFDYIALNYKEIF